MENKIFDSIKPELVNPIITTNQVTMRNELWAEILDTLKSDSSKIWSSLSLLQELRSNLRAWLQQQPIIVGEDDAYITVSLNRLEELENKTDAQVCFILDIKDGEK